MLPVSVWEIGKFFCAKRFHHHRQWFYRTVVCILFRKNATRRNQYSFSKKELFPVAQVVAMRLCMLRKFYGIDIGYEKMGEYEMLALVEMRFKGLEKIRKKFNADKSIMKIWEAMNYFRPDNFRM